jgi:hypothetical protein
METTANDSNFVTCRCRHCEENIEFDANDFAEEFSLIACPHCGLETRLGLPVEQNYPEPGEHATPAQLDYIQRLGLNPPPTLSFEVARLMMQDAAASITATPNQLEVIRAFGLEAEADFSQVEADQIIARMLSKQTDKPALLDRQMQILRFWNRIELALLSREAVAQWLNQFYDEDPRRQAAWEKFQAEYAHIWQDEPYWVPIGVCESYLAQA